MNSDWTPIAQDLLDEYNEKEPRFKNRQLSPVEKEYWLQIRDSEHYRTGLILRKQTVKRMAFMSLPFGKLIAEMNQRNIDLDFMTYLALLFELEIKDVRLKD